MKLSKLAVSVILAVFCGAVAMAAGPAGNSNGSTAVGNGSGAAAYFSASASPGVPVCLGPTSGPNNLLVNGCSSSGVTAVTGTGNISVTAGATPVVSITNAPTFTGNVTALCDLIGTAPNTPSVCSGSTTPSGSATPGSIYMDYGATSGVASDWIFSPGGSTFTLVAAASGATHSYTLNDTNTVAIDSIGGANGTYAGTYTQGQTPLSSDASASTLFTAGQVTLPFTDINGTNSFSVEFLVKVNSFGACAAGFGCVIIGNQSAYSGGCGVQGLCVVENNPTNQISLGIGSSDISVPASPGVTYDLLFTYNGGTGAQVLYLQGSSVGTTTGTYTAGTGPLEFGGDSYCGVSGCYPDVTMQSVSTYNYVLTPTQAAAHYQAFLGTSAWTPVLTNVYGVSPIVSSPVSGSAVSVTCPTCLPLTYLNGTAVTGGSHSEAGNLTVTVSSACTALTGLCSITGNTLTFGKPFANPPSCVWTPSSSGYVFAVQDAATPVDTTTSATVYVVALEGVIPATATLMINYFCPGV